MNKKYAIFNQGGFPSGFYTEDVHGDLIPQEAVEISDEDWQAFLGAPGKWVWVAGQRQPAPEPSEQERVARTRDLVESRIRAEGSSRLQAIAAPYSEEERESWHKQEKEARAWLEDSSVSTPLLSAMAASRGISLEDMVLKVMENVETFEQASGAILGTQQKLLDELAAAQTLEEIEAIAWPQSE